MVPPIQAAPTSGSNPIKRMKAGMTTIINTVNNREMVMATPTSSFLAPLAAPAAIAAETPQTEVAQVRVMLNSLLSSFRILSPNQNMTKTTIGVTTQATIKPGRPKARIRLKRISQPKKTKPVLIYISVLTAGFSQAGVLTVLLINRPIIKPQRAVSKL